MPNRFVLIESPTSGTGDLLLATIRRLGHTPTIFATNRDRYANVLRDDTAEVIEVNTGDIPSILTLCKELGDVTAVGSAYEFFVHAASQVAHALKLNGPCPDAVGLCRSKHETRKALQEKAPHLNPEFVEIRSSADLETAIAQMNFPCVLKLVDSAGGGGVHKVIDKTEAREVGTHLLGLQNYAGRPTQNVILAEALLNGPEYSVECLDGSCLSITNKVKGGLNDLTEIGHCVPANIPAKEWQVIAAAAEEAIEAVGLTVSAAHVEVFLTAAGPKIVEINPRLAGDQIPLLVELATGFPYIEAYARGLLGLALEPWSPRAGHASIHFSLLEYTARVDALQNLDQVLARTGVVRAGSFAELGKVSIYYGNNRNRLGWAIAVSDDPDQAMASARSAVEAMEFDLVTS